MRSRLITADTQFATSKTEIYGFILQPDGSNIATLTIYNEATSSATAAKRILTGRCAATESKEIILSEPLLLNEGCYIDITGTGAIAFLLVK